MITKFEPTLICPVKRNMPRTRQMQHEDWRGARPAGTCMLLCGNSPIRSRYRYFTVRLVLRRLGAKRLVHGNSEKACYLNVVNQRTNISKARNTPTQAPHILSDTNPIPIETWRLFGTRHAWGVDTIPHVAFEIDCPNSRAWSHPIELAVERV
jgi:hypothetical protein